MQNFLIALAAALLFHSANAGEAALSWTNPTQYVDGKPLAAANIARTEVEYGLCTGTRKAGAFTGSVTTGNIPGLTVGTWCFRIRTVTTLNEFSAWTGDVTKAIVDTPVPPIPVAPSVLTVDAVARTAYVVVKRLNRMVLTPVGTVAPGTQCITTQQVNGYFVVPQDSVTMTVLGAKKPDLMVAACL